MDDLIEKFSKLSGTSTPNLSTNTELIASLIAANNVSLKTEIDALKQQLNLFTGSANVTDYKQQNIDETISCDEPLDVIKSLPEFSGKISSYVSWREAANNCMTLYIKGSKKYFAALTILRNKITQAANDTLTNHGTVLNLDAIMSRLDFAYADKRPAHIIEQEMSILRQGGMSILEFYNLNNTKLTLLINKTIMTHGANSEITKQINNTNRKNGLRIFITGLNRPLSDILFSLSPEDLPNALAKAQELESNNMRANFALQYSRNAHSFHDGNRYNGKNNKFENKLRYPSEQKNNFTQNPSRNNYPNSVQNRSQFYNQNKQEHYPKPEPMEIDPSLNYYNGSRNPFRQNFNKRNHSERTHNVQHKQQRINNIKEEGFLDKGPAYHTYLE